MEPQNKNRLGTAQAPLLLATALLVDTFQTMLGLVIVGALFSPLITVLAWLSYFVWYKLLDIGFMDRGVQKLFIFFGAGLLEMIPYINIIPAWTTSVILMIFIVKHEDARYNKKKAESPVPTLSYE